MHVSDTRREKLFYPIQYKNAGMWLFWFLRECQFSEKKFVEKSISEIHV